MISLRVSLASLGLVLAGLSGCAHEQPAPWGRDLALLREEVRALRADREADRRKLEALEAHVAGLSRRAATLRTAERPTERAAPAVEVPSGLSVVRVAPKVRTAVEPDDAGSVAFIADLGDGGDKRRRPPPISMGVGGPTGGPDAAPPLPTEVDLVEPGMLPTPPAPNPTYQAALASLAAGDAPGATLALEKFVREAPRDPAADNALLALGDVYVRAGQPGRALQAFERVVTEFPAGDAVAQALLRYGETCLSLNRKAAARAAFQRVADDHAGTQSAAQALARLKAL